MDTCNLRRKRILFGRPGNQLRPLPRSPSLSSSMSSSKSYFLPLTLSHHLEKMLQFWGRIKIWNPELSFLIMLTKPIKDYINCWIRRNVGSDVSNLKQEMTKRLTPHPTLTKQWIFVEREGRLVIQKVKILQVLQTS